MEWEQQIQADFDRAYWKAFWRSIQTWLTGQSNDLLPFDQIQALIPTGSQNYGGLRQVPLEQIAGSVGRYRDFDRAFLPRQRTTRHRWMNINRAHYEDISLPAIELYKLGEVYFVKDGNHRVSVARQRGQQWIDAVIIELDCPVPITPDTDLNDLISKQEALAFFSQTRLLEVRPAARIELSLPGRYEQVLEHIRAHQWYLGVEQQREVPFHEAVTSWYDRVYLPLVELIHTQGVLREFPGRSATDLYLWIIKHQWHLRESGEASAEQTLDLIVSNYAETFSERPLKRMLRIIRETTQRLMADPDPTPEQGADGPTPLDQATFLAQTGLASMHPEAQLVLTTTGQYEKLLEHIQAHRWYLGVEYRREFAYHEAVASWYDTVYLPLVAEIRSQEALDHFPGVTETELYLAITEHDWHHHQTNQPSDHHPTAAILVANFVDHFGDSASPLKRIIRNVSKTAEWFVDELAKAAQTMPQTPTSIAEIW
jgi:hypothetical protein